MIRGKSWDEYWQESAPTSGPYAAIARFYRSRIISPAVRHYVRRYFRDEAGKVYVHAGCGSAETDSRIGFIAADVVLMDISLEALRIARRTTRFPKARLVCGDLFAPPFRTSSVDGIWDLGVMEHFDGPEIRRIFTGLGRILKPGARCVVFWPPVYGLSVIALTSFLFVANTILRRGLRLYPDEISLFRSLAQVRELLSGSRIEMERTHFGPRDLFTYVVLVGRASRDGESEPPAP